MPQVQKSFTNAFALEPSKLQRILGVLVAAYGPTAPTLVFQVVLRNGKELTLHDVEELLQHDNTATNPIVELTLLAKDGVKDKHCQILFHTEKYPYLSSISFTIDASELRWVNTLSAELEEQIERVILGGGLYRVMQSPRLRTLLTAFSPMIVIILVAFAFFDFSTQSEFQKMHDQLVAQSKAAVTLDAKVDALLKLQIFSIEKGQAQSADLPFRVPAIDLQTFIAVMPLLLVIALTAYAIRYCYPSAVFAWGDMGIKYFSLIQRRKTIWGVVCIALFLALLTNLSSSVLSRLLNL
jgi:hypothetical protein